MISPVTSRAGVTSKAGFAAGLLVGTTRTVVTTPSNPRPLIVVTIRMVQRHFQQFYGIGPDGVRVVRSSIDPDRFGEQDRPRRRLEWREHWGFEPHETVALFIAMISGVAPATAGAGGASSDERT